MDIEQKDPQKLEEAITPAVPTAPKQPSGKKPIILSIVLILVVLVCVGVFLFVKNKQGALQSNKNISTPKQAIQVSPAKPVNNSSGEIFSGQLKKMSEDLGLLLTESTNNQIDPNVTYYEAGTYTTGSYKGYTRYIAVQENNGPMGPQAYIFASKDKQTYIADGNPLDFSLIGKTWPLSSYNKSKITRIDHLPTEQASTIPLDAHFVLWRDTIVTISSDATFKDDLGNITNKGLLQTDFSSDSPLKSPLPYLTMYQNPAQNNQSYSSSSKPSPTLDPYFSYIAGTTATYVIDSTGLAYKYILANPQFANPYQAQIDEYNQKMTDFQSGKTKISPDYPASPNLRMSNADITTNSSLYNSYDIAIPQACANSGDTLVAQNVSDADLQKIGSSIDGDVYILRDKNHTLNKKAFDDKITSLTNSDNGMGQQSNLFGEVNKGMTPPTFDQYMQKNPLLFVKDFWGRWVMLGEFDYHLLGGCGKPVVYLYPPKPTKVSIQFLTPISFDVDIPKYNGGWKVLAQPDGVLTDLQPQFTDCSTINSKKFGSEYAQLACQKNIYPYLYWAGTSTKATYPAITKGWIVEKNNLSAFMNNALDGAGFTTKEKSDFLSYWMPQMMSHNTPYFRISFLQNLAMDQIAPMKVTPMPDHYYRYFLDYLPLQSKPTEALAPESLVKINRSGFTLVEWGGYLR